MKAQPAPTALVSDAGRGSAISVIRSLGQRGWRVVAASSERIVPGFYSRWTSARLRHARPREDPGGAVDAILEALGVPRSVLVTDQASAVAEAEQLGWPAVVSRGTPTATTPGEGVVLQEQVKGEGRGIGLLLYDGTPLAAFGHRRLREVPWTGGASAYRESIALEEPLYRAAVLLLAELRWTGLAMAEFR